MVHGPLSVILSLATCHLPLATSRADTYYVWTNSPSNGPGTNWTTAFHTIQDAVDVAATNDAGGGPMVAGHNASGTEHVVLVTNGIYDSGFSIADGQTCRNRVRIEADITVVSVNGPAVTMIKGGKQIKGGDPGPVRCVYMSDGVLSGFTLTNGFTEPSGNNPGADQAGGGVCGEGGVVSNCVIAGNWASQHGGGAHNAGPTKATGLVLRDCILRQNTAVYGGGASRCRVWDSTVVSNVAAHGGGGLYGDGCVASNCTIAGNVAYRLGGGALGVWSNYMTLHDCKLNGNTAGRSGGGGSFCVLKRCVVVDNEASEGGGGVHNATVCNSLVSGNRSLFSAGGIQGGAANNCTVVNNIATYAGGAQGCDFNNSIVRFNRATLYDNWRSCEFVRSCTSPLPSSGDNIQDDPLLLSASRISPSSPCVGAGTNLLVSGVDIDGQSWLSPPSIGCDEVHPSELGGELKVDILALSTSAVVGARCRFEARIVGQVISNRWSFGDGSEVEDHPFPEHEWAATGVYDVILTAYNTDRTGGVAATATVHVVGQAEATHYVNAGNTNAPVSPYTSWQTAATNIQDAVDACTTRGGLVLVADGTYAAGGRLLGGVTNRVLVPPGVRVESLNGPESSTIMGQGPAGDAAVRCAYVDEDAVLAGFTLAGGHTRSPSGAKIDLAASGGGVVCHTEGLVSNCVLLANTAALAGGGGAFGRFHGCTVVSNSCTESGGGVYNANLDGCLLAGNRSSKDGGGMSGGVAHDCIFANNAASRQGGGVEGAGAFLVGCTIVANSAGSGGGVHLVNADNCVIYGNTASREGDNHLGYSSGFRPVSHCCTVPLPAFGAGHITNAPLFADTANGDYSLTPDSPCIDAGLLRADMLGRTDFDGRPRVMGHGVDIGAHEFRFEADIRGCLAGAHGDQTSLMRKAPTLPTNAPYAGDVATVASLPSNIVDWVMLELRPSTTSAPVLSVSAHLREDGQVVRTDGGKTIYLESKGQNHLVVRHRNHLTVVAPGIVTTNRTFTYDFTTGPDKVLGGTNACVELAPGVWGMIAGDCDGDGKITEVDREIVRQQAGKTGYLPGDCNLDGVVTEEDVR